MEGVRGVHAFTDPKASQLQKKVQTMCGWRSKGFPGSQPVSMDLRNIALLQQKPYRLIHIIFLVLFRYSCTFKMMKLYFRFFLICTKNSRSFQL